MSPLEVLRPPEKKIVFLNKAAVFTCETNHGSPTWKINGTILEELPPEIHSDLKILKNLTSSRTTVENLTIPARAKYNGTVVQCVIFSAQGIAAQSDNVSLKIQGNY